MDMDVGCFSSTHLKWIILLSFPIILLWVIGMPLTAFILMYKNVRKQDNNLMKQYFLILYQGLKPQIFYWEFINTIRKLLILSVLILSDNLKFGIASFMLIILTRIQLQLKPYKVEDNNQAEYLANISGIVTIVSGLIITKENNQNHVLNSIILIVAVILNLQFFLRWISLFLSMYKKKSKFITSVSRMFSFSTCSIVNIVSNIYFPKMYPPFRY